MEIDIDRKSLDLLVGAEELARRKESWVAPGPKYQAGTVLDKYSKLVCSASEGATLAK
eukprot:SAG22_NODE_1225_length_5115_cov_1.965510_5_plen_58_part_00